LLEVWVVFTACPVTVNPNLTRKWYYEKEMEMFMS